MADKSGSSDLPKLAKPAQRALASEGIGSLADVATRSRGELAALHGMGPNALKTIEAALHAAGLGFKED